jgi:hypothetical protein
MFTIIGADGKEYGPVDAGTISAWITAGRANHQTKARRDGETEWKPLGEFAEFNPSPALAAQGLPSPPAAPTHQPAPAVAGPVDITGIAAEMIARAAPLDIFGCLGRSFELWRANFWPLVGVTLLVIIVRTVMGLVPILGMFAGLLLNGVFTGGIYYYYLGKMRGEHREVGDAFAGFSRAFLPLMLTTLLFAVLIIGLLLFFGGPWIVLLIRAVLAGHAGAPPPLPSGPMLLLFLAGFLVLFYLSVSWSFAYVLVMDKGLGPWTAMEVSRRVVTKQWFRVFFTMFCGGILSMLGLIGLIIGVFFTLPLSFAALLYAYEDLCNPPAPAKNPTIN